MSLFTPFGRLNAGECKRSGPQRRDTSGFTCMQRPFLGGERALAVERTNDVRSRFTESAQLTSHGMPIACDFNGSCTASSLTRGGYNAAEQQRTIPRTSRGNDQRCTKARAAQRRL